jgi:uncharacterized membrane protein
VAEPVRRKPPIAILLAIVLSLPLPFFPYDWHKLLHVLGAVLFIGNLVVTAGWMTWAAQRKEASVLAFASSSVNRADQWFTSPGVLLLLINGLVLASVWTGDWLGFLHTPWILAGFILLVVTGGLYGAIIRRYQVEMERLSTEAAQSGAAVPPAFFATLRKWNITGGIGTILPLLALYFMVAKPAL